MITKKKVPVPATEREIVDEITCELCKKKAPHPNSYEPWAEASSYDVETVKVSYESGSQYPEGRFTTKIEFDICPTCFETKVVPWLESQGAVRREVESD